MCVRFLVSSELFGLRCSGESGAKERGEWDGSAFVSPRFREERVSMPSYIYNGGVEGLASVAVFM